MEIQTVKPPNQIVRAVDSLKISENLRYGPDAVAWGLQFSIKTASEDEAIEPDDQCLCVASSTAYPHAAPIRGVVFRTPRAEDGSTVWDLVRECPPLDGNSTYCNLLQCTHFADTCVLAEREGALAGWVSAYRPPAAPHQIFVWQVAVHPSARGTGLAGAMLDELMKRDAVRTARTLATTITRDNAPSWALFTGFARKRSLPMTETPLFERDAHFRGAHATEWQVEIGPFPAQAWKI